MGVGSEPAGPGNFEIVPEDVRVFGRIAYQVAEQLREATATLDREVRGLRSSWTGVAADSYGTGWNEVHAGAVEAWEALLELAGKLGITADALSATDTAVASGVEALELP
ncbi:hypothetical protein GCM10027167_76440 [Nocardia heshunensis]